METNFKMTTEKFTELFESAKPIEVTTNSDFCRMSGAEMNRFNYDHNIERDSILDKIAQAKNAGGDNFVAVMEDKKGEDKSGRELTKWICTPYSGEKFTVKVGEILVESVVRKSIKDCKEGEQILNYLKKVLIG